MMLRLLGAGLLADVAISLSALTPALLVSASKSNDNLACPLLHHGDSRRRISHLREQTNQPQGRYHKHRSVLTVVLSGTEKDRMIIIEPDPSFSHSLSIGWKERNERPFVDLSRLGKEMPWVYPL